MAIKKKMPVFWKIFISITVLFFLLLGGWLVFLYGWLSDYEAVQPKYLAEETFERYFENFDAREFVRLCNTNGNSFETEDNIVEYLKGATDGKKLSYKKVSSGTENGYRYVVLAGDDETKIASFMLLEDESKKGNFKSYYADSFEYFTKSGQAVVIEAPADYIVRINGKDLDESFITEKDIETDSCVHMPEGVSGLYYTKYTVKGLVEAPSVEVLDADGDVAVLENDNNSYKALPVNDADLEAEYSEWILEGVEKYAKYNQYDSNVNVTGFNQVAPYFDPSSALYESIKTIDNMFVIHYDKYEFSDMKASEFYSYDENTFSCRVEYTQKLFKGNDVYDDFVDQTLYLRNVDGKFLIYEMKVN